MKLVHDNGPNYDGELPGVDSCALEDGEEEQFESVGFKESRAPKFFKKLRGKRRVSVLIKTSKFFCFQACSVFNMLIVRFLHCKLICMRILSVLCRFSV